MKAVAVSRLSLLLVALVACTKASEPESPVAIENIAIEVFKSPSCGCCDKWVSHIEANGLAATIRHINTLDTVKKTFNIPANVQSCHTGVTSSGYFFEGHIPAKHITAFLANPPEGAVGLAVPGMPVGSPGMEMGDRFSAYEVLLVNADGSTELFATVSRLEEQY